jgi:multiple sugar transport system substrate-binding protein
VEFVAGVAADVILTWNQVPEMAIRNGFFLDLQPYIKRDGQQRLVADFIPGTVQAVSKNGAIYGFPFYSSSGAMYFNADMLDDAGLSMPDRNWTWDDFVKMAGRLTRRSADGTVEVYGAHSTMGWLNVLPWLWQAGAQAHPADDPSRVTLDTSQAITAFEFLQDLAQRQFMTWDFRAYHYKRAAMSPSGSWEFQFLDGSFPIRITSLPVGPAGRANFTNTDIMAINANTKYPDEAWAFLDWFYSTEVQRKYLFLRGNQPARMSLGYQWIESVRQANPDKDIGGLEVFIEDAIIAKPQPFFSDASVINQHIMPAVQDIILNGAPVRSTLEQMSRIATNYLRSTH